MLHVKCTCFFFLKVCFYVIFQQVVEILYFYCESIPCVHIRIRPICKRLLCSCAVT